MIEEYLVMRTAKKWELLGNRGVGLGFERIVMGSKKEVTSHLATYLNVPITSVSHLIASGKTFRVDNKEK